MSDFLGDIDAITKAFTIGVDRGVRGAIVQILVPVEESFPFSGRAIFQSMGGSVEHETLEAGGLKDRYLARLAERKDKLMRMCDMAGWDYTCHHTDTLAQSPLLCLWGRRHNKNANVPNGKTDCKNGPLLQKRCLERARLFRELWSVVGRRRGEHSSACLNWQY